MNIGHWLSRQAQLNGRRPALYAGRDPVADYAGFHDRAARVAGWLRGQGVQPGDRVAIFMKNCPDYLIVQYGIWYAGAAAVPINAKLHGREAAFILDDSDTTITFASPELGLALAEAGARGRIVDTGSGDFGAVLEADPIAEPGERDPTDLAWLFYTSGTTGKPKGVMITHRMLMAVSLAYPVDVDAVDPEDAILYAAPMSHGAGLYNMIHVLHGARHVCPVSGGFEPQEILDLARHFDRVQMFAAPTMVKRIVEVARATGKAGEGLRTVVYAGGPMYLADIIEAVEVFGPIFVQIYGQGECPMGITALSRHDVTDRTHPRWRARLASVGRAQAPVELRIGDADGQALPPGSHGEIMVRGDAVMPGYWRNPEATAKTIRDGWLMTGDMGFMDDDGYVTLQDRSKDMIISGGSNIYPREVEEVLLTHPEVREVSVVGRAHPEWGEEVVAFVVGSATAEELDCLCVENIARFKRPKHYRWLDELPKNNYGKVLKTELRRMLEEEK
ncbi:class I adenylate-forming enzyme family protein [Ruegeria aquimaris]|uniref:AMP-binding protein n=1 Tax=Ruegeria aquimaris TaxID=2984333 RepID=A0ABT3AIN8_9RHOB|nr:AMP-binding protein [Ruegeria sp. XHP0148]MCV2888537.1 AMP-binding protein [Ruegeria sp. XHP0148]